MPTNLMQPFMAPFTQLAQSNLALLTKYSLSPEAVLQAMTQTQRLFLQPSAGASPQLQLPSNALGELMMGLMKNYMEFLMALGQGSAALMLQGPTTLALATQQAMRQRAATGVPPMP
jgi:hypothetical protein